MGENINNLYITELLHMLMLATAIRRPIVQHCQGKMGFRQLNTTLYPVGRSDWEPVPVHVLWLPSPLPKRKRNVDVENTRYSHVVPLVPHKRKCSVIPGCSINLCGMQHIGVCAFQDGLNQTHPVLKEYKQPPMIECNVCRQWFHHHCLNIAHEVDNKNFIFCCGCDHLHDNSMVVKLKRESVYSDVCEISRILHDMDLQAIMKEITSGPSARLALASEGVRHESLHRLQALCCRGYGPMTSDVICLTCITAAATPLVPASLKDCLHNVYTTEVAIRIYMRVEKISRYLAELLIAFLTPTSLDPINSCQ